MIEAQWESNHPLFHDTVEEFCDISDFCDDRIDPYCKIEHWSVARYWTLEEAVSLASGFDPGVAVNVLVPYTGHPFSIRFRQRVDLANRAIRMGDLKVPLTPDNFIAWCTTVDIPFNAELAAAVTQRQPSASEAAQEKVNPKTKKSLQLIVLAYAAKHKWKADAKQNKATASLMDAVASIGLSIDDGTVRRLIDESFETWKPRLKQTGTINEFYGRERDDI